MALRWTQRYTDFCRSLEQLKKYVDKGELTELESPGFIQTFEFVSELAWNTIKEFYEEQGSVEPPIQGSKDAVRLAVNRGLIQDGKAWFRLIKDRNPTSHTYHEELAKNVAENICSEYYDLFRELAEALKQFESSEETNDVRT